MNLRFKTFNFIWDKFKRNPSKRGIKLLFKIIYVEFISILIFGKSIDEFKA